MIQDYIPALDIVSFLLISTFFLLLESSPLRLNFKKNTRKDISAIPGPYSLPLIGTTWIFALGYYTLNQMHRYYEDLHKQYGSIIKEEMFFNVPVIHVFEKRDIEEVFKSCGKYPLRPPCEAVAYYRRSRPDRYTTTGIVNEQGEAWYSLRQALSPTLMSPQTISSFLPQVREIVDDWCHLIRHKRDHLNQILKLEDIVDKLSLEITCALMLGRRMGFLIIDDKSETAHKLGEALIVHFRAVRDTYFGLPLWKIFKTDAYKRMVQAEEIIYGLASELIQSADDSTKESTVFQSILNARLDDKEKTVAIIDFISAGIHTLKNSLLFLLHLVSQDEQIQQSILRATSEQYAKACTIEMFRLMPVANVLCRIIEQDVELSGYSVKSGSIIICQTGIACKDERNFRKPNNYLPERWLNNEENDYNSNASCVFKPFGIGRRICPGKRFIEYVLPIILDCTVRNFHITSNTPLELQYEFLMTPARSMPMFFNDRI